VPPSPRGPPSSVPDDVLVTEVTAGGVPAHWFDAPGTDTGRVLHLPARRRLRARLASQRRRAGRPAGTGQRNAGTVPEYRLAPEHPFSAAIDDVLAAWRWLRADQDPGARSIAVAGDSAGGGLTVALLVALRDAGEALPAATAPMSPTVDLTSSGASMTERADQDPISCHAPSVRRRLPGRVAIRRPWRRRCLPHCPGCRRCLSR
jgi:monoterpene epsilon-lactone hydrolase